MEFVFFFGAAAAENRYAGAGNRYIGADVSEGCKIYGRGAIDR